MKNLPYGLTILQHAGNWFLEQRTVSKIETLGIFDEEYKAKRHAQKLILSGELA